MSEQGGASTATGHSYGRATVGSGGDEVSFGSPGVGHSYGKGGSADGSRPYGGGGGVEAKPYTGGAKVEAKPFSEELGGVVNL